MRTVTLDKYDKVVDIGMPEDIREWLCQSTPIDLLSDITNTWNEQQIIELKSLLEVWSNYHVSE